MLKLLLFAVILGLDGTDATNNWKSSCGRCECVKYECNSDALKKNSTEWMLEPMKEFYGFLPNLQQLVLKDFLSFVAYYCEAGKRAFRTSYKNIIEFLTEQRQKDEKGKKFRGFLWLQNLSELKYLLIRPVPPVDTQLMTLVYNLISKLCENDNLFHGQINTKDGRSIFRKECARKTG